MEQSKSYQPDEIEKKCLNFWEQGKFFQADAHSQKPPFTIVMPPPNVTGVLHMGHALVNTLQDIVIRFKRMRGFEALWIPGTDHAGIATQTVVERHLKATENKRRSDYSREEFLAHVWQWKEKSEKTILMQLKSLGCSADWSRLHFTMDPDCNKAVRKAFKKLYDEGLIYRGNYLVNWDPVAQTALSDDEVEYEERQGHLWYFTYHLVDSPGSVTIATTRPETMLGDTAVAVNPKDSRYSELIGQRLHLPIVNRTIPIIADHHVDPTFGTGAVKVTPAHDPNDYRMGIDHNLEMINILTPDGTINENGGPLKGLSREEARVAVVKQMQLLGHFDRMVEHTHRVGVSYRSKAVIEPYLSKQWFVKMEPFAKRLKTVVLEKKLKIIPPSWEQSYFHWIDNLRDWCISRQLWWGHRIPIWYHVHEDRILCSDEEEIPEEVAKEPHLWKQDPDVLDTWFSSGLWPLSTLGWPEKTPDLQRFYPTSLLITGHDILFFWVARMVALGDYLMGQVPFHETFLHALIFGKSYWRKQKEGTIAYITGEEKKEYDLGKAVPKGVESKWEKLSKSKGNVIDPLEMMKEYGTDAVRMALCFSANQPAQIDLDRRQFEECKNFANKIWNGARFVFMNLEDLTAKELMEPLDHTLFGLEDRWLFSRLNSVNKKVVESLDNYQFEAALRLSYDFFWKEFCAYYVEIVKPILFGKSGNPQNRKNKQKILTVVLANAIRLLHPMAPFITEELFGRLRDKFGPLTKPAQDPYIKELHKALQQPSCSKAPFPTVLSEKDISESIEKEFALVEEIVYAARNIRGEMKMAPGTSFELYIVGHEASQLGPSLGLIRALLKNDEVHLVEKMPKLKQSATKPVGSLTCIIPISEEVAAEEKKRLEKEREQITSQFEAIERKLANEQFVTRADPDLVAKQRELKVQLQDQLKVIHSKLETFK